MSEMYPLRLTALACLAFMALYGATETVLCAAPLWRSVADMPVAEAENGECCMSGLKMKMMCGRDGQACCCKHEGAGASPAPASGPCFTDPNGCTGGGGSPEITPSSPGFRFLMPEASSLAPPAVATEITPAFQAGPLAGFATLFTPPPQPSLA